VKLRRGSITISIIPHNVQVKGRTYKYQRVCYFQDGKFHRPIIKDLAAAKKFADDKAIELSNGRTAADLVTPEDAAAIARIKQIMAQRGITKAPELAIAEYCEHLARIAAQQKPALTFSALVKDFLAVKENDGTRFRQRKDLRNRLAALEESFACPLTDLTAGQITEAFDALQKKHGWENRTRNHYRAALSNLVEWARRHSKIPRDWKEMEFVLKLKERDGEIIIWTPDEAAQLFLTAEREMPDLVPTLVLACFIGHRQSEATGSADDNVEPLDWSDLHLGKGYGYLAEGKVRSAGNRITFIPPNACAWLKRYQRPSGPVCPFKNVNNQYVTLAKKAGITWKQNANRRSYISYRLAITRNLPQVSEETGTSIVTLRRRYAKPRPLTEARKYFNIMPTLRAKSKATRGGKFVTVEFSKPAKKAKSQNIAKTSKVRDRKSAQKPASTPLKPG
jgi:integrase